MNGKVDLVVRGGTVVTSETAFEADLAMADGRFVEIAEPGALRADAEKEYDATGLHVLPGVIDGHVHFREPGYEYKEDWPHGSTAAVMGGVTTVFDMPNVARQHLRRPAWVVGGMSSWLRSRVTSVLQTSDGSVVVHLASGVPVYYGDATEVTSKDQALAAVLRWAIDGHHPIQAINVRAPLAPTATLQVYVPPVTVPVPASGRSTTAPFPAVTPVATPSVRPSAAASPSRAPWSPRSGKPVKARKPVKGG